MDKVEKFKENLSILKCIRNEIESISKNTLDVSELISLQIQYDKLEKELIKMFQEEVNKNE